VAASHFRQSWSTMAKEARVTTSAGSALTPLIGRERELRVIESKLATGARLIALLGPGGSGKTRVAREVFDRCRIQGPEAYTGTVLRNFEDELSAVGISRLLRPVILLPASVT
jgi:hypothetical protein